MKRTLLAGLAAGVLALGVYTPAQAQGGCGPYAHRGWDGWCHPGGGWRRPWGPGYAYGWHRPGWGPGWHRPGWGYRGGW